MPCEFFSQFWEVLGPELLAVLEDAFQAQHGLCLLTSMTQGVITLLYKGKGSKAMLSLKGILQDCQQLWAATALLNSDYKLLAKALATRFGPALQHVVDPTQTAFVPGQWICDNVLCRLEEVEYLQQTGQPGCMVFLNFSKAYDRLSRPWVLYCMSIMAFFVLGGFRRIVHPPSDDEGTEQTWFEPEQRPRLRVPKRSVHGKQFPRGASKTFWRQDDQPWWQGRSCYDTV